MGPCASGVQVGHQKSWRTWKHLGVSINRGTPKLMVYKYVYKGKSDKHTDDDWGYQHLWKPPYPDWRFQLVYFGDSLLTLNTL